MTGSRPSQPNKRPSIVDTLQSPERLLRQGGRDLIVSLYATLRSLKLYPVENTQGQRSLDDLAKTAAALLAVEYECDIRLAGDFVAVNSTPLRRGLDNYAAFSPVRGALLQWALC